MFSVTTLTVAALLAGAAFPLVAQTLPAPTGAPQAEPEAQADEEGDGAIVVTGQRERGAVLGDIPPEIQLTPADIRTYGAASVAELLEALAPQTRSGRGRGGDQPVTLLDGRRISGFGEIRDLPTEAILRVDILPEEVALKYGYRADQRVVNFVLRPRFRALSAEGNVRAPVAGDTLDGNVQAGLLRINRGGRFNLDVQYGKQGKLFENDRGIVPRVISRPFDLTGNVAAATFGGEIDPALSAQAGSMLSVVGVPTNGARSLAAFAGAPINVTDTSPFRTLRPSSERISANATLNRTIFDGISATINARVESTASESLLGLPTATLAVPAGGRSPFGRPVTVYRYLDDGDPLTRASDFLLVHGGVSLNGNLSDGWRWSLTANYDRTQSDTRTDRGIDVTALQAAVTAGTADPFGPLDSSGGYGRTVDTARSVASVAVIDGLLTGTPFELPAGEVGTTIRIGATTSDFSGRSVRSGIAQSGAIARDSAVVRANLDLPIANAARDILAPLGRLSLNANAEVERLSDFGALYTIGYGINWSPVKQVRLIASATHEDGAPRPQQLGDPTIVTPNALVFDYLRGETVEVTRVDGGNPALGADNRHVLKIGLSAQPWEETDLNFRIDYNRSRIDDAIAGFPAATAAIEAAFPDRFQRDTTGRLLRVDARPVNFARNARAEIRYGFDFATALKTDRSKRIEAAVASGEFRRGRRAEGEGRSPPESRTPGAPPSDSGSQTAPPATPRAGGAAAGPRGEGRAGGFGGRGGGRGFGGGGFGGAGGRIQFGAYHTVHLQNSILIRPGVPILDLLDGDATGSRGGQPRHEIEVSSGLTRDGFGARLSANWQSATRVDGLVTSSGTDLRFGTLTRVNLQLFANLGQRPEIVRKHPFLRGSRVTFGIENALDSRISVTDALGNTPLNYQPGYLDPLGRTVRLGFRKLF